MPVRRTDLLRVQAHAFNAQDLETLVGHYTAAARFIRDGTWVGEGPEAVRKGLEEELRTGAVGRLHHLEGEPVLVEYTGDEGHEEPTGIIRFEAEDGLICECRVDHDPRLLEPLRRA